MRKTSAVTLPFLPNFLPRYPRKPLISYSALTNTLYCLVLWGTSCISSIDSQTHWSGKEYWWGRTEEGCKWNIFWGDLFAFRSYLPRHQSCLCLSKILHWARQYLIVGLKTIFWWHLSNKIDRQTRSERRLRGKRRSPEALCLKSGILATL